MLNEVRCDFKGVCKFQRVNIDAPHDNSEGERTVHIVCVSPKDCPYRKAGLAH